MRLTKISTRTGDEGKTGLGDGSRVDKDSLRIAVIGDVDELNSSIGLVLAENLPDSLKAPLLAIQHDLFELGAELCLPGQSRIGANHVSRIDENIEKMNADLSPLKEFVLPGGSRAAALCHLARTVCRRTERSLVALSRIEQVGPESLKYLNRLSDFLFIIARRVNKESGSGDVLWQPSGSVKG
ncbi:MAG: cob(I)yrinic acid a,c-diamide adenosyltransferase [Burkholderiales bacterium]